MSDTGELSGADERWLLRLARTTLENLEETGSAAPDEGVLGVGEIPGTGRAKRGAFVTLHKDAQLRGCIGYVEPLTALYRTVIENAVNAARRDPRFPPVKRDEVAQLHIEISVLTRPHAISDVEEIEVGRDGLIVSRGAARGLLLPQVASERGWSRETFLDSTCRKAGLAPGAWRKGDVEIQAFSAQVFSE